MANFKENMKAKLKNTKTKVETAKTGGWIS